MHIPNPDTYRMYLGKKVNIALFQLCQKENEGTLDELSVTDYVEKMVEHWWKRRFPDIQVPFETKRFDKDLDFVQSV
jgi:hypothetical protein